MTQMKGSCLLKNHSLAAAEWTPTDASQHTQENRTATRQEDSGISESMNQRTPLSERLPLIQSSWGRLFLSRLHHQDTLDGVQSYTLTTIPNPLIFPFLTIITNHITTLLWGIEIVPYLSVSNCTGKAEWDGLLERQGDGSAIDAFTRRPSTHPIWTLAMHFSSSSQARRTRREEGGLVRPPFSYYVMMIPTFSL